MCVINRDNVWPRHWRKLWPILFVRVFQFRSPILRFFFSFLWYSVIVVVLYSELGSTSK